MDGDLHDPGLSGAAWFQAGRVSAENARQTDELFDALCGNGKVSRASYGQATRLNSVLTAENQRLRAQIVALQQSVADWEAYCARLKAWGEQQAKSTQDLELLHRSSVDQADDLHLDLLAAQIELKALKEKFGQQ